MRPIIEFCQSNLATGTLKLKEKLEQDPRVDVIDYGCLGNCGECYEYPYALVDGKFIAGKSLKDLYEKIMQEVEKSL